MLFQAFPHHFGGLTCLKILVIFDLFILVFQFIFILFLEGLFLQLILLFLAVQLTRQLHNFCGLVAYLFFFLPHCLRDGKLFLRVRFFQPRLEVFYFAVFVRQFGLLFDDRSAVLLLFGQDGLMDCQLILRFAVGNLRLQLFNDSILFRQLPVLSG